MALPVRVHAIVDRTLGDGVAAAHVVLGAHWSLGVLSTIGHETPTDLLVLSTATTYATRVRAPTSRDSFQLPPPVVVGGPVLCAINEIVVRAEAAPLSISRATINESLRRALRDDDQFKDRDQLKTYLEATLTDESATAP